MYEDTKDKNKYIVTDTDGYKEMKKLENVTDDVSLHFYILIMISYVRIEI